MTSITSDSLTVSDVATSTTSVCSTATSVVPATIATSLATADSSPNSSGLGASIANASANTAISNSSLSDSMATSRSEGHRTPSNTELLSKTNLYIRGLKTVTNDQDLFNMCSRFGQIVSTKAIMEKTTGMCKGYGFVEFTSPQAAELAVQELTKSGIQAQMAKISPLYTHNTNGGNTHRNHNHHQNSLHHHNQHHTNSPQNLHNGSTNGGSQHQNHHQQHSHHHHNYHPMSQHGGGSGGNANSGSNHSHHQHHHQNMSHNNHGGSNSGGGSGINTGTPSNNSINSPNTSGNSLQHSHGSPSGNTADPTNLYIANLPSDMGEQELEELLSAYGPVVSTRILRDDNNIPRGVGFARMETRDKCEQIIEQLNAKICKGCHEPLVVKFADGNTKRRQHHSNHHQHNSSQHQNQHQQHHNNSGHHHHQKIHQTQDENSRWRDNVGNTSDLGSVSNYDHQNNIPHSNHLTDLAIMGPMGYSRIPAGFAPPVAAGSPYPPHLAPQTGGPQWLHPAGPGQPYVMPQQMLQAGGLGPSNQVAAAAAAAAALHYGHIPQLTSQMQSLQITAHPAPHVGYAPPSQWSPIWPHPIAAQHTNQGPMRPTTPMRGPTQSQNP